MTSRRQDTIDIFASMIPSELKSNLFDLISSSTPSSTSSTIDVLPLPIFVLEKEDEIVVRAEMPNFKKDTIEIDFFNNRLDIRGTKIEEALEEGTRRLYSTIKYGTFFKQVTLPISVTNKKNVSTKYADGVLTIKINKTAESDNKFKVTLQQ
jgi:HSP20 family molecular chaperone IbpA